jgi:hypothetical protein
MSESGIRLRICTCGHAGACQTCVEDARASLAAGDVLELTYGRQPELVYLNPAGSGFIATLSGDGFDWSVMGWRDRGMARVFLERALAQLKAADQREAG